MGNRAIAFRELGQVERIVSLLANDAPDVPNIARISTWPLFDPVKNELWFKSAFIKKSKARLPRRRGR